ncbi:uncharacterized protein SKDI_11G0230 [Saccharomyces kudriavzevii IFO 1802]|uniref:Uncharacterized protein n=1 Tax=Saccharomyces kudriavzevii (strain ATCC MYA-4449 / AS 2.2408 / CBS 8840 / NBRC 1802 / NCYC 2889) TaxID=226230 RepID=A0AA35NJI9_SACK1|nr:uncharacterized protein SKDI_11G0230 [Saccharomyces kudriavzevii IFO 1802]CAI4044356.1 hypothetical protein SKDI_11G0230 [Saccharomyces kudriavzevii IFO 1802]
MNIWIHGHNTYAITGEYSTDSEYDQRYGYYGHGYPLNYDKDYDSYGDSDSSDNYDSGIRERGNGNWPDEISPDQQIHWCQI